MPRWSRAVVLLLALIAISSAMAASSAVGARPTTAAPPAAVAPKTLSAGAPSATVPRPSILSGFQIPAADSALLASVPGSLGAAQLQAATASLSVGSGPASGVPMQCSAPTSSLSISCESASSSPRSAPSPAASSVPSGLNFQWGLVGMPSNRQYASDQMVYDAADGYVLLFGGQNYTGTRDADTWTYHEGVWTQLRPSISPTGRDTASMTYDAVDGYVLLFGGFSGSIGDLGDTWTFRGGSWSQVVSAESPSPRYGAGIAFDPTRAQVILFGGSSDSCPNDACNDTWGYWFGYWFRITTAHAPTPRYRTEMTWDGADHYVLLFGGSGVGCLSSGYCQDTWKFDGTDWVQLPTGGAPCGTLAEGKCPLGSAPGERQEASFVFDASDNTTVLYGGINATSEEFDTWTFNAGNWTKVVGTSPGYRWGTPMAYDASSADGYVVLFGGGWGYGVPIDQIWKFHAGAWSLIQPVNGPPLTIAGSMAYDPVDGYVVYFGGYYSGIYATTWTYRAGVWTALNPSPSPLNRYDEMMTWDSVDGYIMLYGGNSYAGIVNDTWSYLGGHWTELCTYGSSSLCTGSFTRAPPARFSGGLAPLPTWGYTILFGGNTGSKILNDTWIWWSGGWYDFTWLTQPAAREYFGMVYDPQVSAIVLFGGYNGSAALGDTWELSNPFAAWTEVGACGAPGQPACPSNVPAARYGLSMTYDSERQEILVYGGVAGCCYNGQPAFAFRAGGWNMTCPWYFCYPFSEGYTPGYRVFSAMTFDAADGYSIIAGGETAEGFGVPRDTWAYAPVFTPYAPLASPTSIDMGQTTALSTGASGGGDTSYSFSWAGLPSSCVPPAGASTFSCTPTQQGFNWSYGYNMGPYSYYIVNSLVFTSNGFPSVSSPDGYFYLGPDPKVSVASTAPSRDVGQTVWFNATGSYGMGPYKYAWSGLPGCPAPSGNGPTVECNLTASSLGYWSVTATLTDGAGFSVASVPVPITVYPDPNSTAVSVNRAALDAGQVLTLGVSASGGLPGYTYTWSNIPAACQADVPMVSCTVPAGETGTYTNPAVLVTDANGASVLRTYSGSIVVSPRPTASALSAVNGSGAPTSSADVGQALTFGLTASFGSGGETITWSGLPAGCSAPTGAAVSVPCTPTAAGSYAVSANVADSNGVSVDSPSVRVDVSPGLSGVQLSASATTMDAGQSLVLGSLVSGGSGVNTYDWSGLPAGCAATASSTIMCVPGSAGSSTVHLTVTDSNGATAAATLPLTVNARLGVSVTQSTSAASAPGAVTFTASVTGGTAPVTLVWLVNGSVDTSATGSTLTLTGLAAGTYSVQVLATDGAGATASSPVATGVIAPAPAPFATTAELAQIGLLAVAIVLGALAVVLLLRGRRPPSKSGGKAGSDDLDLPPPK